jgi:hypothetical protein
MRGLSAFGVLISPLTKRPRPRDRPSNRSSGHELLECDLSVPIPVKDPQTAVSMEYSRDEKPRST